jgi:imidazolonepropionase
MTTLFHNISQLIQVEHQGRPYKRGPEMAEMPILHNGWMLVLDGRITDLGSGELPATALYDSAVDLKGQVVLPAFVDSHSHLVYAANREDEFAMRLAGLSYEEIANAGGGILNSAAKLGAASEDQLLESAQLRLNQLMKMGTGALEIKSGYGLNLEAELKMLRVAGRLAEGNDVPIKRTFLGAHAIPLDYKGRTDDYMQFVIDEMLPAVVEQKLADYVDVFCEEGYFSLDQSLKLLEAAKAYNLPAKVHVNQFNSLGAIEAMVDMGALSLDHLEVMSPSEIKYLAESQTIATGLPGCSLFLNIPYAPGRAIIDAGGIFALATDFNPGSAPSGNMALMMSLACSQMKLRTEEALVAATLNGAAALELSEEIGSLEIGKWANFICLEESQSLASLAYHFGHNLVQSLYLKGLKKV